VESADIIVGGGGIIGLSLALELVRNGFRVKVIERGRPMAEASHAAAGMLAADDPENPPDLVQLATLSRSLYPDYLKNVEQLSGSQVPLRTRGTLQVSEPGVNFHCTESGARYRMDAEEAERRVPGFRTGGRSLLWLEEASLDPRDLCAALPLAAVAAGVILQEGTAIQAIEAECGTRGHGNGASVRIRTSAGDLSAAAFVNCCGAWASTIACSPSLTRESAPPAFVEPRKGQMAAVRVEGTLQLRHVIRSPEIYLVPRGDTRVVIGASVERAGFDREVQSVTIRGLLDQASELWPPIASAHLVESWAGLRPGTHDGLPFIGSSGLPNCWLATGHFRNGILLAPGTARVVCQLLQGHAPEISLDAFALRDMPGSSDNAAIAAL
jgi:glycine oxidase